MKYSHTLTGDRNVNMTESGGWLMLLLKMKKVMT